MFTCTCRSCGSSFEAQRGTAVYCGATCRQRARRSGLTTAPVVPLPPPPEDDPPLVVSVRAELARAKRADSVLGQQAIALAGRLATGSADTGSAVASLSKELRAVMAEAMQGVPAAPDALDQLAARRIQKASGA